MPHTKVIYIYLCPNQVTGPVTTVQEGRGDCGSAKISETFQTILGYVEDKIVHSSYCMIGT